MLLMTCKMSMLPTVMPNIVMLEDHLIYRMIFVGDSWNIFRKTRNFLISFFYSFSLQFYHYPYPLVDLV